MEPCLSNWDEWGVGNLVHYLLFGNLWKISPPILRPNISGLKIQGILSDIALVLKIQGKFDWIFFFPHFTGIFIFEKNILVVIMSSENVPLRITRQNSKNKNWKFLSLETQFRKLILWWNRLNGPYSLQMLRRSRIIFSETDSDMKCESFNTFYFYIFLFGKKERKKGFLSSYFWQTWKANNLHIITSFLIVNE